MNILLPLMGVALLFLGLCLMRLSISIGTSDRNEFRRNTDRMPSISDAILGRMRSLYLLDYRVAEGLAYDKKTGAFVSQSTLSKESFDNITK